MIPAVFIAVGAMNPEAWPGMLIGLVFLAIIGWLARKDVSSPRAIRLTAETVQNLDQWRWHSADVDQLNAADVENLRIHQSSKAAGSWSSRATAAPCMWARACPAETSPGLRDFLVAEMPAEPGEISDGAAR